VSDKALVKPIPIWSSFVLFGIPTIIFFMVGYIFIPYLSKQLGILLILSWFISGGLLIFLPLFIASIVAYRLEGNPLTYSEFKNRFRLAPITGKDWIWTIGTLLSVSVLIGLIIVVSNWLANSTELFSPIEISPPFIKYEGLQEGQNWILIVWLPFFFFNIFGEELFWHGYILPRQELSHGKWAWMVNGLFWTMFHSVFGLSMVVVFLPLLFCIPYVVQKRKNTWIGIILHGFINGLGFLLISFKLL